VVHLCDVCSCLVQHCSPIGAPDWRRFFVLRSRDAQNEILDKSANSAALIARNLQVHTIPLVGFAL
jgi:hypothetical protein